MLSISASLTQIFGAMDIPMTSSTKEYLRRRDNKKDKESKRKKRFDVKARMCQSRNQKIREGTIKDKADERKGLTYRAGMAGPFGGEPQSNEPHSKRQKTSGITCTKCCIAGHSRSSSKFCAWNDKYQEDNMETWCQLVRSQVTIPPFDATLTCQTCDRVGHLPGSFRCIGHPAFDFDIARWHDAMFSWDEDAEVYYGECFLIALWRLGSSSFTSIRIIAHIQCIGMSLRHFLTVLIPAWTGTRMEFSHGRLCRRG